MKNEKMLPTVTTVKAQNTHRCRVTPKSRSSLTVNKGDITSCPYLSRIKIFHTGSTASDVGTG